LAIKRTSSNSLVNATKMSTGFSSAAIPNEPTIGAATATSDVAATIAYTAATLGALGSTFTATSTPSSITGTGSSPITVTGLTASTSYTFSVTAGNANGTSAASSASNSITTSAPLSSYESIATSSPTSGTSISFSSIPQTFKHLQLRINWNAGVTSADIQLKINSTAPTQAHRVSGNGTSASAAASDFDSGGWYLNIANYASTYNNYPAPFIIDFLDYSDTNKNKTARALVGTEYNGGNTDSRVGLKSAFWNSTSAISSIQIAMGGGAFGSTGNSFALYGIKGA